MISGGKHLFGAYAEPAGQLGKRGSLVVRFVAEPGIDVVSDYSQIRDSTAVLYEILMNDVRILVVARDETERRVGILINRAMD